MSIPARQLGGRRVNPRSGESADELKWAEPGSAPHGEERTGPAGSRRPYFGASKAGHQKPDGGTVAGNVGLPFGQTDLANLSMEYGNTAPTSRSVQREDAALLIAAGNDAVADPAQPRSGACPRWD